MSSNTIPARKVGNQMRVKASARSKSLTLIMFASFHDPDFQKIDTKQVRQLLRAFLTVASYAEKGSRLRDYFYTPFRPRQCFVALTNRGHFLQSVFNSARRGCFCYIGHHILIRSRGAQFFFTVQLW